MSDEFRDSDSDVSDEFRDSDSGVSDEFRAPDFAEPIVGWRYWRLDPRSRLLTSLTGHGEVWPAGRAFEAQCRFAGRDPHDFRYKFAAGFKGIRHQAPGEGCTCGVHAAKDLRDLRAKMLFGFGLMVVGEVFMWGRVVPGTRGYRAQYAYPKRLFVVRRTVDWDRSDTIRQLLVYGVPVEAVAYRDVAPHFLETLAVGSGIFFEGLSKFGEAIAGSMRWWGPRMGQSGRPQQR